MFYNFNWSKFLSFGNELKEAISCRVSFPHYLNFMLSPNVSEFIFDALRLSLKMYLL